MLAFHMGSVSLEASQDNIAILALSFDKRYMMPCIYVGIIGFVGDLQPGHLFVSQFTSYLYILLGD